MGAKKQAIEDMKRSGTRYSVLNHAKQIKDISESLAFINLSEFRKR